MRLVITGGRFGNDEALVDRVLTAIHRTYPITLLISGGATGYDRLCEKWARTQDVPILRMPADWTDISHPDAITKTRRDGTKYDARAGTRRNQDMIDRGKPDRAVSFPGGTGTADMVRRLRLAGIPCLPSPP